jgi:hypothetical protein
LGPVTFRVFENTVLRRLLGLRKKEISWEGHVARMGDIRNA